MQIQQSTTNGDKDQKFLKRCKSQKITIQVSKVQKFTADANTYQRFLNIENFDVLWTTIVKVKDC